MTESHETVYLHDYIENMARRFPNRVAVEVPPGMNRPQRRSLSYAQLEQRSDSLAYQIQKYVVRECVVAVLLPRGAIDLYSAQLGILKSGAAYVCIDPAFPDEHVTYILEDCRAVALITDDSGLARMDKIRPVNLPAINMTTLAMDRPHPLQIPSWLTPNCLAYIIYTSGTTGRPKGVMIEHASIVNLVNTDIEAFALTPDDRVGQSSSPAYDSSVEEIWLALSTGATLVVMDDDTVRLGPDLAQWLHHEHITVLCPPPTLLRSMGHKTPAPCLPDLRLLYVGGEALPPDVVNRWAKGRRLVNGYGPTECTVTALRGDIVEGGSITIGQPISGVEAWVLDPQCNEVARGQAGELCIGGRCLARGYLNPSKMPEDKFISHPRLGRVYRTGDRVHCSADGLFFFHGRQDSQVKLRGYRIECEAVEACLMRHEAIRQAACYVHEKDGRQVLVALVEPNQDGIVPDWEEIKQFLGNVLPSHMIPGLFGILTDIPKTIGGKLDRKRLSSIAIPVREASGPGDAPRNELEQKIAEGFKRTLNLGALSLHGDFFNDLGGDSLQAALLISFLREDTDTCFLTVRDLYEARSVRKLAQRAETVADPRTTVSDQPEKKSGHPLTATLIQTLWLALGLFISGPIVYILAFQALPAIAHVLGMMPLLLLSPLFLLLGLAVYTPVSVGLAVLIKRLFIGAYRPVKAPAWGNFYVRNWMVCQVVRIIPWSILTGTEFQNAALRLLGANIGRRVHIHRGVDLLQGGWDLLTIGDDVTIGQDASLQLVDIEDGSILVGAVVLGDRVTLEARAGVGPNTRMEADASLSAMSFLPSEQCIAKGACYDGVPAKAAGASSPAARPLGEKRIFSPVPHAIILISMNWGISWAIKTLLLLFSLGAMAALGTDPENFVMSLLHGSFDWPHVFIAVTVLSLQLPVLLLLQALCVRSMGRVREGVISRWTLEYGRIWIKTGMVESAGKWLSGSLFWPIWLRWAGMQVGNNCEISTIIDVVPELIDVGDECFFADGIYLGGPRIHRGSVTLSKVTLERNTFLGNHVIIQGGQRLPADLLLGVCTVADDRTMHTKSAWFGRPAFRLPRKADSGYDPKLTHHPPFIRYVNRLFWEVLRFALPMLLLFTASGWGMALTYFSGFCLLPYFIMLVIPMLNLSMAGLHCLLILCLKWLLLGRVRPGTHPLWSCWCSRWDFLYVAWGICARGPLTPLQGTLLISWYLRAMGAKIGRHVLLNNLFAQVVDPDMLTFEDGATVNCLFQAHTFEDRVLKIDRIFVQRQATAGHNTVLLYGADLGRKTCVAPYSVVMKHERLLPYRVYAGVPVR